MKKPPYKAYKKKKEENPPLPIPEKIDTPQAEQLVSDLYKLYDFLLKHKKKIAAIIIATILIAGSFGIYKWHEIKVEKEAALLVDKGLFYLQNNDKQKAFKYFESAVSQFPNAPSSKIAAFLLGKLNNQTAFFEKCENYKSFLVSPPSITSLAAKALNENKISNAESLLDKIKRDKDWTYPEALEYREIAAIMKNNLQGAKDALDALRGDYPNLPITQLANQLLPNQEEQWNSKQ